MPAGALPPNVVTGQPIASAWGNAVVDNLKFAPVNWGTASMGSTAMVNATPILHQSVPAVPYATTMFAIVNGYAGSDSATMDGVQAAVNLGIGGTRNAVQGIGSSAGRFGHSVLTTSWAVPANGNAQFSMHVGWTTTGGGTTYVAADLMWFQFR